MKVHNLAADVAARYTKVPNCVIVTEGVKVTAEARLLWCFLAGVIDGYDTDRRRIAERLQVSEHIVRTRLSELEGLGWVEHRQKRRADGTYEHELFVVSPADGRDDGPREYDSSGGLPAGGETAGGVTAGGETTRSSKTLPTKTEKKKRTTGTKTVPKKSLKKSSSAGATKKEVLSVAERKILDFLRQQDQPVHKTPIAKTVFKFKDSQVKKIEPELSRLAELDLIRFVQRGHRSGYVIEED